MQLIDNLSDESMQSTKVVLADGSVLELRLRYAPAVQRWFLGFTRNDFAVDGIGLCVHPNLLRQWRNVLPFGLACTADDLVDPVYAEDFLNGRVLLYVLTSDDVQAVEDTLMAVAS